MTPVRVSTLSSVIFIVVLKSCVRAHNFHSLNSVKPMYVNSNHNFPFYIEPSFLTRRLCLINQWYYCSAILTNSAIANVRQSNLQSLYQIGLYQGASSQQPEIKNRVKQARQPQFGKRIGHIRGQHQHLPTARRSYSSRNEIPFNAYTQLANKPYERIPQTKSNANINLSLNTVHNQSIIEKIGEDLTSSVKSVKESLQISDLFMAKYFENPGTDESPTTDMPTTRGTKNEETLYQHNNDTLLFKFTQTLDQFERKFYLATLFQKTDKKVTFLHSQCMSRTYSLVWWALGREMLKRILNITSTSWALLTHIWVCYFSPHRDEVKRATFNKLSSISPIERRENGISFIQSGLLLYLMLTALSLEVDLETKLEIDKCIGLIASDTEKIQIVKQVMSSLPMSSDELKFLMISRLVMAANVSVKLQSEAASSIQLRLNSINVTDTPEVLARTLNNMIEVDSGGSMRKTFEENDLMESVHAMLMSTVYVRARWRSAPTLLNGTHPFRDTQEAPPHSVRMIRINDVMQYADLREWDAEALEISYATPDLSLLLLVPRGRSLRQLATRVAATSLKNIIAVMQTMRVAVSLPLYTLRMTLLLPNKLQFMGMSRILNTTDETSKGTLRLSHAIQRLMFWAEAGRNAFKDDGIEWDEHPELELVVDKPYMFFVRWRNLTLINGNFVN